MKKHQEYVGRVERVDYPNIGIVIDDDSGDVCKVKNVLEGQRVRFRVCKVRKSGIVGNLIEVIVQSPLERESYCPHSNDCGGCNYQTLNYPDQLRIKEKQITRLIGKEVKLEPIISSPTQFEYRNKMEYTFGDEYKSGPIALGHHKRNSFYDIINTSECVIIDCVYKDIMKETLKYARERDLPHYNRGTNIGYLRHLLIRKSVYANEYIIGIVTTTQLEHDMKQYVEHILRMKCSDRIVGIIHIENDGIADIVKNDRTNVIYGRDYIVERILGLDFKITPFSFFQTNSLAAEVLYSKVREYVSNIYNSKIPLIYDLYSGTGTIAQLMSDVADRVIGVEIVEEAVEAARANAKANGAENCEFIAGDVLKIIDELKEKPDIIILDPPRDGVHPKAWDKILRYGVENILYISCKPTSFARDMEVAKTHGYSIVRGVAVDMYAGTVHVETVCLLTRINTGK